MLSIPAVGAALDLTELLQKIAAKEQSYPMLKGVWVVEEFDRKELEYYQEKLRTDLTPIRRKHAEKMVKSEGKSTGLISLSVLDSTRYSGKYQYPLTGDWRLATPDQHCFCVGDGFFYEQSGPLNVEVRKNDSTKLPDLLRFGIPTYQLSRILKLHSMQKDELPVSFSSMTELVARQQQKLSIESREDLIIISSKHLNITLDPKTLDVIEINQSIEDYKSKISVAKAKLGPFPKRITKIETDGGGLLTRTNYTLVDFEQLSDHPLTDGLKFPAHVIFDTSSLQNKWERPL